MPKDARGRQEQENDDEDSHPQDDLFDLNGNRRERVNSPNRKPDYQCDDKELNYPHGLPLHMGGFCRFVDR